MLSTASSTCPAWGSMHGVPCTGCPAWGALSPLVLKPTICLAWGALSGATQGTPGLVLMSRAQHAASSPQAGMQCRPEKEAPQYL